MTIYQIFAFSLKLNEGSLFILCLAHLAGAISLKNGGKNGLVILSKNRLKFTNVLLALLFLIPYKSLNSKGNVLKAVKAIKGQIGFMCIGTGPLLIIS